MNPARLAIRHGAVTLTAMTLTVLGGILAYGRIGRLEDPEFTIKEAVVYTQYPGATAEEVELEVTEPLETAIQQLKPLKEVRSISRAGLSIIFAEIQETYDKDTLPQVWDELRRKVSGAAGQLPPGCQAPFVNDDFGDVYGVLFAITGDGYSPHDLREFAKDLRRELLLCEDVGRIDLWGAQPEAVYVEIDRAKLAKLGVSPKAIFTTINRQNAVTAAGQVRVGAEHVRVRLTGDYGAVEDIGEQLIEGGPEGRMIRVKDIATIQRGYQEPPAELLRWNGRPAIGLGISTVSGGNVIAMGDAIGRKLRELEARTPIGIRIHAITHQGETVRQAVSGFMLNLAAAVAIVILLLVIFMGIREGFIIAAVLLLTILATFIAMHILGITLQRISLGALIISLGMLVDNAIVVAEGIVMKLHRGMGRAEAAEATVRETQWPLLGATAIAILAFAAITLSKDMTGEWLKSLFQVICLSLGLSWLLAITIAPYLCVALLPKEKRGGNAPHQNLFYRLYRRLVGACINHRWLSLTAAIAVLVIAAWAFSQVQQDFMPDMNRPQFTVDFWLPEGTHIEETAKEMAMAEERIRGLDGVTDVAGFAGRGPLRFLLVYEPEMPNSAYGQLLVSVEDFHQLPRIIPEVSAYLAEHHPRAITSVDAFKLGPGGGAVVARLTGPEIPVLRSLAEQVRTAMRAHGNTRSIRSDWGEPVKAASVALAETRTRELSIARPEIARSLAMNFSGAVQGVYRQGEDLLPIILRPPLGQRCTIGHLGNVQVWSESRNHWLPLEQVIDGAATQWEDPVIRRLNRIRTLSVSCKQRQGTTDGLFRELSPLIEQAVALPPGYALEWGGEHEEHLEANRKLMANVPVAFIAMFLVSVMLFNTLRHPLIIFLGLPLSIIGVAPGLLLADKAFGFMAMLGFLSLSGMLMKNEIVLLDQINLELAEGKHPYRAVLDSAVSRVRPVSMAAFTTVLGMLPLLWDAFFAPMAVTIMGGLTFATVLTLVVVPVLYSTLFRVNRPATVEENPS